MHTTGTRPGFFLAWKPLFICSAVLYLRQMHLRALSMLSNGKSVLSKISYQCTNHSSRIGSWSHTAQARRFWKKREVNPPKADRAFRLLELVWSLVNCRFCRYDHRIEPTLRWSVSKHGGGSLFYLSSTVILNTYAIVFFSTSKRASTRTRNISRDYLL